MGQWGVFSTPQEREVAFSGPGGSCGDKVVIVKGKPPGNEKVLNSSKNQSAKKKLNARNLWVCHLLRKLTRGGGPSKKGTGGPSRDVGSVRGEWGERRTFE